MSVKMFWILFLGAHLADFGSSAVVLDGHTTARPRGFHLNTVYPPLSHDDNQSPDFIGGIDNVTAAVGRTAVLSCSVTGIGEYKVGWMKAEDGTILTVHGMVVTHNPRISINKENNGTFQLKIRLVKESDRGCYMCQINTIPMKKQLGCVDVHIPPEIMDQGSSSDVEIDESGDVDLVCVAEGKPTPRILWRREDGEQLQLRNKSTTYKVDVFNGSTLPLKQLDRKQMAAYLCIATNEVPPTVSKRIMVRVNFAPSVFVGQQLVGVPTGSDARLECIVQAFPPAAWSWMKNRDELIINGDNYVLGWQTVSTYEIKMSLVIKDFGKNDIGTYMCVATNIKGKSDGTIRLYEIKVTTTTSTTTTTPEPTTTTDMEDITIARFIVPIPQADPKLPDVTTYDTMENVIEQSVVDNALQATEPPHQKKEIFSSGTCVRPVSSFTFLFLLSFFIYVLYANKEIFFIR